MKTPRDLFSSLAFTLSVVAGAVLVYLVLLGNKLSLNSSIFSSLIAALFGALASAYVASILRTLNKNPTPLKIALLGAPGSGKTVFVTVLFDELLTAKSDGVAFSAYGRETIEQISENLTMLRRGSWLPRTPRHDFFTFRANVRLASVFVPKRYTVEIGDFAGENLEQFDPASDYWLHKGEYFKYVLSADAIFLAVDGGSLARGISAGFEEMQQGLIAALQILVDEKGAPVEKGIREPVALLILKADLLKQASIEESIALERIDKLVRVCRRLCLHFNVFFVSAVGHVDNEGAPPDKLEPMNVIEPMIWALRNVNA